MRRRIEIIAFERERIIQQSVTTECPICLCTTELLTPSQAAALIQVDENSIERWLADGDSHGVTTPGGHRRVCKKSLLKPGVTHLAMNPFEEDMA